MKARVRSRWQFSRTKAEGILPDRPVHGSRGEPSEFKFSAIFSLALMTVVNFPNGACTAQLCAVATDLRRGIMYFIVFLFD